MFRSSNIASFFLASPRARELAETREAWNRTEELWRASPLGGTDSYTLATELVQEIIRRSDRPPTLPILIALADAFYELYHAEAVGPLEANWTAVENNIEAAMEVREMLPRRRRWAADFGTMHAAWKNIVLTATSELFSVLPEACFGRTDGQRGDTFEVPLIDLLDDPALVVDRLFMLPYADDSFRLDLFKHQRELCATNLLIASGFQGNENIAEVQHRLVRAPLQKKMTGAELARVYLRGSPFQSLLDAPVPFRIPDDLRFEHCHIVGGTGHGKTQLMQKMIHADLMASREDSRSVVVIDSQGDLINKLVRLDLFSLFAESSLADRLVLIDPSDIEFPAALNLFDAHLDRIRGYSAADRERVLNGVIELYELFFGAFLGAELTQKQGVIFKYLARLMLVIPGATIHTLMKVMENGREYQQYIDQLDGSARYFFETEFFAPSFSATKKQVLRRLWGVLSTPAFERMFTQPENKLDLFKAMNEGKIILVSTAKEFLKREGSQLLGRFFVAMIAQAALERSTVPENKRNAVFVYVDEAQEYFDDSIETILNQARKYRVGLTLAHQTLDQLSPRLRSAIFSNTSMKCVGGVSAKDARTLADELRTTPEFLEGMKRQGARSEFAVWVKHLTGRAVRLTCPLGFLERQPTLDVQEFEELVAANRSRYGGTPQKLNWLPSSTHPAAHSASQAETQDKRGQAIPRAREEAPATPPAHRAEAVVSPTPTAPPIERKPTPAEEEPRELGKGGRNHRYLQSLVKELADQHGIRATIEAPLPGGGQVDVLLERDVVLAAVEISISTPVAHEVRNLRKCLDAGYPRIGVVLAKSKASRTSYVATLSDSMTVKERERVSFLSPEDVPDFVAAMASIEKVAERMVRGYRVKSAVVQGSLEEAQGRRDAIAKLIAKVLSR